MKKLIIGTSAAAAYTQYTGPCAEATATTVEQPRDAGNVDRNEFVTVVTIKVSLRRELNRYLERLALTAVEPSVASVGDFLRQLPPHRNHI